MAGELASKEIPWRPIYPLLGTLICNRWATLPVLLARPVWRKERSMSFSVVGGRTEREGQT